MALVTVNQEHFCPVPGIEVVNITADDAEEYVAKTIKTLKGAIFQANRDSAVTDSWGVAISGATATIHLVGTTTVTGTLILFG